VRITVCFTVEVSTTSFSTIEEAAISAGRDVAKQVITETCARLEAGRGGRRRRKARFGRRRTVLTRAGYVTIHRGRSRRADGTRFFPLDDRLGLPAHREASVVVRARGCVLAAEHPYREAARLLSTEVGEAVDHRAIWRWVQADGDAKLKARAERVNALFADGEAPEGPEEVPERLTVAADATGIRLIGGASSVKVAVAFTASEQVGETHKRRLVERMVYADLAEVDPFGMALATELEHRYGYHLIPHVMLLGDGEPWIAGLGDDWLPGAAYQCDHWHVGKKIRDFCRPDLRRYPKILDRAFHSPQILARDLRSGRLGGDPEQARLLAGYLEGNAPHLHTYRRMGPGHWLHGSGPVEKHVELTVNRRFKRRGMRWSRSGARNLLAIRLEVIAAR
jgi:Uncharacterised protein family (UPF0236)